MRARRRGRGRRRRGRREPRTENAGPTRDAGPVTADGAARQGQGDIADVLREGSGGTAAGVDRHAPGAFETARPERRTPRYASL